MRWLRLDQIVGHLGRRVLRVQVPDVYVVRAQRLQTGLQVFDRFLAVQRPGLGRNVHLVPPALDGGAEQPFVVAALVVPRGIEVIDPQIERPVDDARVRGDHAAESHRAQLQPGLAERPVLDLRLCRQRDTVQQASSCNTPVHESVLL